MQRENRKFGKQGRNEKDGQFVSIEKKISKRFAQTILFCCVLLGVVASVLSYISSISAVNDTIDSTSDIAADYVAASLKQYTAIAYETGSIARLADVEKSVQEKEEILNQRIKDHNFQGGYLLDDKGVDVISGKDFSAQDYFKEAMKGETFVSTPTYDEDTKSNFMRFPRRYGRTAFLVQRRSALLFMSRTVNF